MKCFLSREAESGLESLNHRRDCHHIARTDLECKPRLGFTVSIGVSGMSHSL